MRTFKIVEYYIAIFCNKSKLNYLILSALHSTIFFNFNIIIVHKKIMKICITLLA